MAFCNIFIFEICYYYFWMIVDFNDREIYGVGQLCDPKDRENFVQIRMYNFILIIEIFYECKNIFQPAVPMTTLTA